MQQSGEVRSILWRGFLGALALLLPVHLAILAYLFFGSGRVEPSSFRPGVSADLSGAYVPNDALTRGRLVATRWVEAGNFERSGYQGVGPETVAVGPDGRLYAGLCDAAPGGSLSHPPACRTEGESQGWIVRINPKDPHDVQPYVQTGGRPLGLAFDARGRLYVADAMKGLLRVESALSGDGMRNDPIAEVSAPFHTVVPVATCNRDDAHPDPQPDYTDSVAVAKDGSVWFTCPSQRWSIADIRNDIMESAATGRVLHYTPCADRQPLLCAKRVLVDDLRYANGIAVLEDDRSLLVNEWTGFRITRLFLTLDNRLSKRDVFFDNTPGYPDNITVADDGTIWVGMVIRRQKLIDRFRPYPLLMRALAALPADAVKLQRYAWLVGLDRNGHLKWNLQDATGFYNQATGGYPMGDALYVASYTESSILCVTRPGRTPAQDPCDPWAQPAPTAMVEARAKDGEQDPAVQP
jgi:sugar lactone lactonase YvrE